MPHFETSRCPSFFPLCPSPRHCYYPVGKQRSCPVWERCKVGFCMQLTQSTGFRMEQRQLLTPRMIQSMEILQLPLLALEERIEQELQANPVLELRENEAETAGDNKQEGVEARQEFSEGEQALVVKEDSNGAEDFERLAKIGEFL